jgi:EmrB/QacA subfamily drug resistance transporter
VSLLIIVIDNTIVNVTLPSLVRQLGASVSELQWVVDAYTVVFAGLLLLAGTLGDRWGRRRALTIGLAVFAVASSAAAFAGGVGHLVAARAAMGGAAAFIMPATLSILTNTFTVARERAMAIGIWSGVIGIGVVLGPLAGGFLLDHFWWGSVFIVNVPIAVGAIVAARVLVSESRDPHAQRVDWIGGVLSVVGLVSLVTAIIEAPSHGWTSLPVVGLVTVSAAALAAFAVWEGHVEHPMLDVRLFANRRFSAASATITLVFFALFGFVFLSTQYLQFVLGYTPFDAGLRTLPFAAAMIVVAPLSSRAVQHLGTKRVVVAGMLIFAVGLVLASTVTTTTGYPRLGVAMVLLGAGLGLSSAPTTESIMGALPRQRAGVGSAVNDTAREVGGALGVAIVGSVTSSIYRSRLTGELPTGLPDPAAAAAHDSLGAALQISGRLGAVGSHVADAAREAFVAAMSQASIVTAVVAAVGAIVAWRYLPARGVDNSDNPDESSPEPIPTEPWYIVACTCSYAYGRIRECTMTARDEQASCPCTPAAEASLDDERTPQRSGNRHANVQKTSLLPTATGISRVEWDFRL